MIKVYLNWTLNNCRCRYLNIFCKEQRKQYTRKQLPRTDQNWTRSVWDSKWKISKICVTNCVENQLRASEKNSLSYIWSSVFDKSLTEEMSQINIAIPLRPPYIRIIYIIFKFMMMIEKILVLKYVIILKNHFFI